MEDTWMNVVYMAMCKLWNTNDFLEESYHYDLLLLSHAVDRSQHKTSISLGKVTDEVVDLGLVPLFAEIYAKSFYLDWTDEDHTTNRIVINMNKIACIMVSATNRSVAACEQVVETRVYREIIDYLADHKLSTYRLNAAGIELCTQPLLDILHNVVQKCEAAVKAYHDASAVHILQQFRSVEKAETRCVILFTLSFIVLEDETDKIRVDDDTVVFAIKALRKCCDEETDYGSAGFRIDELIRGLNNVAKNDSNKKLIVNLGALPLYTKLLKTGKERDQQLACEGLRRLAKRCSDDINKEPGCVDALQALATGRIAVLSKEAKCTIEMLENATNDACDDEDPVDMVAVEDYITNLRQVMDKLSNTGDFLEESYQMNLEILRQELSRAESRTPVVLHKITEAVVKFGLVNLFADIYAKSFHLEWTHQGGGTNKIVHNMNRIASAMVAVTDRSVAACEQVVETGVYRAIIDYLADDKVSPYHLNAAGIDLCAVPLLRILHNVVQKCEAAAKAYHDAFAVNILEQFRSVKKSETRCIVLFTLSYVVLEGETDKICVKDDTISFAMKTLRKCCDEEGGCRSTGFRTDELIEGLNNVAKNDSNKNRIIREGALPLYTKLLTVDNHREQQLACEGLRRLAMRHSDEIKKEPGCVDALHVLVTEGNSDVSTIAKGIIELLENADNQCTYEENDNDTGEDEDIRIITVRQVMGSLRDTKDFLEESYQMDLETLRQELARSEHRTSVVLHKITEVAVELGLVQLFADIYEKSFYLEWTFPEGGTTKIVHNMHIIASTLVGVTDRSVAACEQVVDSGVYKVIINYLADNKLSTDRLNTAGIELCTAPLLNILHNVVQKSDAAAMAYHDASAVQILHKFRLVEDAETRCVLFFTLSHIILEGEMEKINVNDATISFAIRSLSECCNNEDGRGTTGFRTDELVLGLNNIAKNDSNKRQIARLGALPLYTKLLIVGKQREQQLACEGLRRLAWECSGLIRKEDGCVEALQALASGGKSDMRKIAIETIQLLEEVTNDAADPKKTPDTVAETPDVHQNIHEANKDDGGRSTSSESDNLKRQEVYLKSIRQTMQRLYKSTQYMTKNCRRDIKFVSSAIDQNRSAKMKTDVTNVFVDLGLTEIFANIYRECFSVDWSVPDGAYALSNLDMIAHSMQEATDSSVELCNKAVDTGLTVDILKYLKDPKVQSDNLTNKAIETLVIRLLSILHHVVQKCKCVRKAFQQESTVDALRTFQSVDNPTIKCYVILVSAYTVPDNERGDNREDYNDIGFIINTMQECNKSKERSGPTGLRLDELLEGLIQIAMNFWNKEAIVHMGVLPVYTDLLTAGDEREQGLVCRGLCQLSSPCRELIKQDSRCVEALRALAISDKPEVRKEAELVLQVL